MKLPENITERYISAVERETERTRLYNDLVAAQLAYKRAEQASILANQAAEDAAMYADRAQNELDAFDEERNHHS